MASFKDFDKIQAIYNSLPEDQKLFVAPKGRLVDSPYSVYRHIAPEDKGFVELYKLPGADKKRAFVTMAVRPEHQGKGVGKYLLQNAIETAKSRADIESIIYRASNKNKASQKIGDSIGQLKDKSTADKTWEIPTLSKPEEDIERILEAYGLDAKSTHKVSPDKEAVIRQVLAAYKKKYGIDMSDVKFIEDPTPRFNNGKKVPKELNIIPGGSWTKNKKIYLAPDMQEAMNTYGVKEDKIEFLKRIIAHELGHEVWHNHADDAFKKKIADQIAKKKFTTSYLEATPEDKKDYEAFAEYLADTL